MSIRESFDWVALPAGVAPRTGGDADRVCRVSIFVAPQITLVDEPARTLRLDELTDLLDWPAALADIQFEIEVEGQPAVPATRVGPAPRTELWRRLFPGTTNVQPFVPDDPTVHTVVQYGAGDVLDVIETGYAGAATLEVPEVDQFDPEYWQPDLWMPAPEPPEEGEPLDDRIVDEVIVVGEGNGETHVVGIEEWSIRNLLPPVYEAVVEPNNSWLFGAGANMLAHAEFVSGERNAVPSGEGMPLPNRATLEMARFADAMRLTWEPRQVAGVTEVAEVAEPTAAEKRAALIESYDLHRSLAALGDHPALLRALGIVIDLEVPMAAPEQGRIRAVVRRPEAEPGSVEQVDRTPWLTVTSAAPNGFAATSATDDIAPPGLEALDQYRIVQLHLESAGIQLLERAAEEATGAAGAAPRQLPALRTSGLRLVERGAAERLLERAAHTNELRLLVEDAAVEDALDADDVQRGFRLDVLDETSGHWHTLHARRARYATANGKLLDPVTDEGSFASSFTGRPLAPGEQLDAGDVISVDESLVTWDGWSLAAPRPGRVISADPRDAVTAHRAEHGTEIAVRPENAPLTSTGLRIDTSALPGSLPRLRFGRTYRMRLRSVDLAGNALTVAQANAATSDTASMAGAAVTEPVTFRRFERVSPPVPAFVPDPAGAASAGTGESERRLVVRSGLEDGDDTFGSTPDIGERLLFAPECSVALAEWHGVFDDGIGAEAIAAARAESYRRAAREAGTLEPDTKELPWLADPAASGACFSGLPGMDSDEIRIVTWPESPVGPGPIRLRLVGLDNDEIRAPDVDETAGVVTVFLPPGGRATAAVSSVLADEDLMALPTLWRERLDAEALADIEARLARHRHAMVTPTLPIEFVHATQRPRLVPERSGPGEFDVRVPDQTDVRVIVPWTVHAPTTGTVELEASWTVPRDQPTLRSTSSDLGPDEVRWTVVGDNVKTAAGRPRLVPAVPLDGPFATTVIVGDAPEIGPEGPHGATIELDTTAHVGLRLRAIATSRFAEFFPPEYGPAAATKDAPERESRLTAVSDEVVVEVPNTRRPPAPTVVEALPLVVRRREAGVLRREGGWLRIWLARPWFITGWDELPAVLAAPDGQPPRPGHGYEVSTLVAPDPARGVPLFNGITPHALGGFPGAWVDVHLIETEASDHDSGRTVALSDRPIDWDPDRGAWFVDLRVDVPDLYFPFVRIAIARDQPQSIRGDMQVDEFRVSPVVTLDPIQMLPDRELRHAVTDNGVRLDLTGRSYDTTFMPVNRGTPEQPDWQMEPLPGGAPSAARVIAQRRVRSGGDELLAWEDIFEQSMAQAPDAPVGTLVARRTLPFDPTEPPGEFRLVVLEEDFAHGPQIFQHPEGTRARVTFAEVVPLPRAVAPSA